MKRIIVFLLIMAIVLTACSVPFAGQTPPSPDEVETLEPSPVPTPTATSEPPITLTVCTSALPTSLFPYDGIHSPVKENLLSMIAEAPFERVDSDWVPVILEKVPAQSDGDLRLEPVSVQRGQTVVDALGELVVLKAGVRVRPSGCRQADCTITWDGEVPLEMDRMVMDFELKDGVTWSDGTPVTAVDSVFSHRLANAPEAPGIKWAEERTEAYSSLDAQTVQWVGRPGFTTAQLDRLFWTPLPSHLYSGSAGWGELIGEEQLTTNPLSYGPYVLSSWEASTMRFVPNPYFLRPDQGLPRLDEVVFRVVEGGAAVAWQLMQSGDCNVLDSSFGLESEPALLAMIRADERFDMEVDLGEAWTQLVFGIQPASYDEFYNPAMDDLPDFFGDPRTRQAFAHCLDRETMLDLTMDDLGTLWPSFLPPTLSQLEAEDFIVHDPALGLQDLEQAGWRDHDANPETPLQAWGGNNVPAGTPLSVELLISPLGFHQDLAAIIRDSLGECGIGVTVTVMPAVELYAPGPEGLLFGRDFDLALLSWQPMTELDCSYYQSWRIPSDNNQWIGTNLAGFSDEGYDTACATATLALPDEHAAASRMAEQAFITALPAVPLFAPPQAMVFPSQGCNGGGLMAANTFFALIENYSIVSNCAE